MPLRYRYFYGLLGAFALSEGAFSQAYSAPDSEQDASPRCISIVEVRRKSIVDEMTVRLQRRGKPDIFVHFDQPCPQLTYHSSFFLPKDADEICRDFDWITTRSGNACLIHHFSLEDGEETAEKKSR